MVTDFPPLIQRIRSALEGAKLSHGRLHVSVAHDLKWEKSGAGGCVHVRWLCWSIDDGGKEVAPPEFEVIHEDVTCERLAAELPAFFPGLEVRVDHDITVP